MVIKEWENNKNYKIERVSYNGFGAFDLFNLSCWSVEPDEVGEMRAFLLHWLYFSVAGYKKQLSPLHESNRKHSVQQVADKGPWRSLVRYWDVGVWERAEIDWRYDEELGEKDKQERAGVKELKM